MSKNVWRCRCGKRVEVLTDKNFGDCGCSDPVYGPEYFYMSEECADMLDEMDKDYDKQHKQLAEARAEIDALRMGKRSPCDYYFSSRESEENLYRDLAEVRADLRLAKNIIEMHVERVAERDKLIEQMRDALKALKQQHYVNDDDNWYSCPASGLCSNDNAGTDCNCGADYVNSIIEAALSAAERGE
jgi:YHS domain-containing protein